MTAALGNIAPASAPAPAPRGGSARADGDGFARLLQGKGGTGTPAPAGDSGPAEASARAQDPARERGTGQPGEQPGGDDPAGDPAVAASAAGTAEAADDSDTAADDGYPAADAWPPPGLGWLLQPVEPAPVRSQPGGPAAGSGAVNDGMPRLPGLPGAAVAGLALAQAQAQAAEAEAGAMPPAAADILADTAVAQARGLTVDAAEPAAPTFVLPMAAATPAIGAVQAAAGAAAATAAHLPTPGLHDSGFAEDVGSHVQWAAGQKLGHALIRISPQDLGPVEVRLQLDGDRLSADFSSAHAEVRQALEQGLSRLREMLGQQGLELAHAGVGDDRTHGHGQGQAAAGTGAGTGTAATGSGDVEPALASPVLRGRGLLDAYA